MKARMFLNILSVFVSILAVCYGQFAVSVELTKPVANIGEELTVTCMVNNENEKDFFIVWVKKLGEEVTEIGSNEHVNVDFKEAGRFKAHYSMEDEDSLKKVTFSLTISDLQASDSGEIGCKLPSQNINVFKEFTVLVPIKSIKLTSMDTDGSHATAYINDQNTTFDEGQIRRFSCYVNGSYPKPLVQMFIGDQNITSNFQYSERLIKDGDVPGLQNLGYEVSLINDAMEVSYDFSGKKFRCEARVPGTDFKEASIGINIKLAGYKPKFVCPTTVSGIHKKNVNITCKVHSDPPVKNVEFYWYRKTSSNMTNMTLVGGERSGHYKADIGQGESDHEIVMTLNIDRVFVQHFRKYYFKAGNDLGEEIHEVELLRDASMAAARGSASRVVMTSLGLFALLTAIVVL